MPGPTLAIREQCPLATSANDGLMSAEQARQLDAASGAVITTNTITIVDNNTTPVSGSVPTVAEALASGANLLQLKASATLYEWPVGTFYPPLPVGSDAVPLALTGEMSAPLVNGTETVGGDTGTLTDGSLAMTPGANRGKFAQILTGALAGTMVQIVDNTGTAVSLQSPIGNIGIGDTWQIVEPAATLSFPDTAPINIVGNYIGFSKLNLVDLSGSAAIVFSNTYVVMQTCTFSGFFNTSFESSKLDTERFASMWASAGAQSPFATPSAPSVYATFVFIGFENASVCHAKIVGDIVFAFINYCSVGILTDTNIQGCYIECFSESMLEMLNTDGTIVKSTLDGDPFGSGSLVTVDQNSSFFSGPGGTHEIVMNNSSGSAMFLKRGAYASAMNVTGTGNTAGFELSDMSRLVHGTSTVTGATDVLFDGSSTSKAYGALPFVDTADLSQAV